MNNHSPTVSIVLPTLNAAAEWPAFIAAVGRQTLQPQKIIVVDSSSADETVALAERDGCHVVIIAREDFNHGSTRQLGVVAAADSDIVVLLTQDALLVAPEALKQLIQAFDDPQVGAAYGRQLPRVEAGLFERHPRSFNYPAESQVRSLADSSLGIRSIFISNSFAAYRRAALISVGGFPSHLIMGEDTYVAGKMLLNNWKIAYVPTATVRHSHGYTVWQEFQRYFDIGVLHAREALLFRRFGTTSDGKRYVVSELRTVLRHQPWLMPASILRSAIKLLGYRLGLLERLFSPALKRRLSMHRFFWDEPLTIHRPSVPVRESWSD